MNQDDDKLKPEDKIKFYDQLCTSYHKIEDFRATLLGLLPLVTGAGMTFSMEKLAISSTLKDEVRSIYAAAGVFGVLVTLGLFAYEIYGITKCAALIKAGRDFEIALGVVCGPFRTRPDAIGKLINEPFASGIIYPAVLAAWTYFTLAFARSAVNPSLPIIPIVVFAVGLFSTVAYDFQLRKGRALADSGKSRGSKGSKGGKGQPDPSHCPSD